jgi:hypothetical protein
MNEYQMANSYRGSASSEDEVAACVNLPWPGYISSWRRARVARSKPR